MMGAAPQMVELDPLAEQDQKCAAERGGAADDEVPHRPVSVLDIWSSGAFDAW